MPSAPCSSPLNCARCPRPQTPSLARPSFLVDVGTWLRNEGERQNPGRAAAVGNLSERLLQGFAAPKPPKPAMTRSQWTKTATCRTAEPLSVSVPRSDTGRRGAHSERLGCPGHVCSQRALSDQRGTAGRRSAPAASWSEPEADRWVCRAAGREEVGLVGSEAPLIPRDRDEMVETPLLREQLEGGHPLSGSASLGEATRIPCVGCSEPGAVPR